MAEKKGNEPFRIKGINEDPIGSELIRGIPRLELPDIVASFPRKERKLLQMPNLEDVPWDRLDFLGWTHTSGHLGYVVYEFNGNLCGVVLRATRAVNAGVPKSCSWCNTLRSGNEITLYVTGNVNNRDLSIGDYICRDLQCNLYVRRILLPNIPQVYETVDLSRRVQNLKSKIDTFFTRKYT